MIFYKLFSVTGLYISPSRRLIGVPTSSSPNPGPAYEVSGYTTLPDQALMRQCRVFGESWGFRDFALH